MPNVDDPTPEHILKNPKWYPYFKDAIGALDGSHVPCCPSAADQASARNRKGWNSQNTLAAANWSTRFQLMVSGHDGSEADSAMYEKARIAFFRVPPGKYYLADAGFGACDALLVPYRGVHYHLSEWGRAGVRYTEVLLKVSILN